MDRDSYLLELLRYVVLNPVRARMVERPRRRRGQVLQYSTQGNAGVRSCKIAFLGYTCRMSRPLRLEFAGALYHVTSRGDRREDVYNK